MCPSFEFAELIRRVLEILCQFSLAPRTFPWLLSSHKCKNPHFVNETIKRALFENHLRAGAHQYYGSYLLFKTNAPINDKPQVSGGGAIPGKFDIFREPKVKFPTPGQLINVKN